MADARFFQDGFDAELKHLIGECGEVTAAAAKLQQFGPLSVNPLLPKHLQETNIAALWREIGDLEDVIRRIGFTIYSQYPELGPPAKLKDPVKAFVQNQEAA